MKLARPLMLLMAMAGSIGGALAGLQPDCTKCTQYFRAGESSYDFTSAGYEGMDYTCFPGSGVCTFYLDTVAQQFKPCKYGSHIRLR